MCELVTKVNVAVWTAIVFATSCLPGLCAEKDGPSPSDVVAHSIAAAVVSGLTVTAPVLIVPIMAPPPKAAAKQDAASPLMFPIGSKFSRTVQKVTGVTFISDVIASQAAKKVVRKKLGGDVKVKVKTFGLTDLLSGKIKSVSVSSKGGAYKNVPLGQVEVASKGPIWYQYKHKEGQRTGLKTPVMLDVKGELRTQDIIVALGSEQIAKQMRGLKLDLPGLGEQQLQVVHPQVEIGDNSLKVDAILITVGGSEDTGVPITISGTPILEGDKIFLRRMKVDSPDIVGPEKFAAFAEELLNPIVDFSRMDRHDSAFRLKDLAVKRDVLQGGGELLLAPRPQPAMAQSKPVSK